MKGHYMMKVLAITAIVGLATAMASGGRDEEQIVEELISKRTDAMSRFYASEIDLKAVSYTHLTPFQWESQNSPELFLEKHNYLAEKLRIKGVTFHYHDNITSVYEAVFARGDRRCGKLLLEAYRAGCKFDSWTEHFKPEAWEKAFTSCGLNKEFYTERKRTYDEILPWDLIDCGVSKKFLICEAKKAYECKTTADCRHGCTGCGIKQYVSCELEDSL